MFHYWNNENSVSKISEVITLDINENNQLLFCNFEHSNNLQQARYYKCLILVIKLAPEAGATKTLITLPNTVYSTAPNNNQYVSNLIQT